jgi:DNA-binding response OmpR family regulator
MEKKKILIVEDELDISKVLSKEFLTSGYEVHALRDAVMVVKEVRDFKPDLIVLDLMLPGGGGLSVLENLERIPSTQNIPVVVLTGMKNEEYKKKVLAAGVAAYVEKPYEFENLLSKIRGLLGETIA